MIKNQYNSLILVQGVLFYSSLHMLHLTYHMGKCFI